MPTSFADRVVAAVKQKGTPSIVGLDPRLDWMPDFVWDSEYSSEEEKNTAIFNAIVAFHACVLDQIYDLVPAVKLQIAFYEQYGLAGIRAFVATIQQAKDRGLLVIVDAKRNDIGSTADAYADAFLGTASLRGEHLPVYDVDCITVSPFLGRDSLEPFISRCQTFGKGIFILVKTSNPGSVDLQDKILLGSNEPVYMSLAQMVNSLGEPLVGQYGYSSIGAVVGATFPAEAARLREAMPNAIFLVPGYGAQGGKAQDVVPCFNSDGLGALVNASRTITYSTTDRTVSKNNFLSLIRLNTQRMIDSIREYVY